MISLRFCLLCITVETLQDMGTITQSRPQLRNDNEQERPAECLLGSVTSVRFIAAIHASTFHKTETEAATAFVVLNSGLELYADLIARERGSLLGNKLQPTKDDELGGDPASLLPDYGTVKFVEAAC